MRRWRRSSNRSSSKHWDRDDTGHNGARELIAVHIEFGNGYNRNAARMAPGEVMRDRVQAAVDPLIRDYGVAQKWGITPGASSEVAFK